MNSMVMNLMPSGFAKIEDANDVFVRDLARQDQFLLETVQNLGVRRRVPGESL